MSHNRLQQKFDKSQRLDVGDMCGLMGELQEVHQADVKTSGDLEIKSDRDGHSVRGKKYFTLEKHYPLHKKPVLDATLEVKEPDVASQQFTIVEMAQDSETSQPENGDSNLFFVGDVIQAVRAQVKPKGTLLIPLAQRRGILKLPNKKAKREHTVLLEINLDKNAMTVHDWRASSNNWFYPDKLKNVAQQNGFQYQYHCYENQSQSHLSDYYVHNGIISILKEGNSSHLENLVIRPRHVRSKQYYKQHWQPITEELTRPISRPTLLHHYHAKRQQVRKVMVWDFDGVINNNNLRQQDVPDPQTKRFLSKLRASTAGDQIDPLDVVVDNVDFLQLTLDILHDNGVQSVCGSQRLTYAKSQDESQEDQSYLLKEDMFSTLRTFAPQGEYFKRDEMLERKVANKKLDGNKNIFLDAYQERFSELQQKDPKKYAKLRSEDIFLVDDSMAFKAPAEEKGYQFVHAKRALDDPAQSTSYLCEILTRTVKVSEIYESMNTFVRIKHAKKQTVNAFKQHLLRYQLENLDQVAQAQMKCDAATTQVENARNLLLGIRYVIASTKWDLGWFGGEELYAKYPGVAYPGQVLNMVPKNMLPILKTIQTAEQSGNWLEAFAEMKVIANRAQLQGKHHFWNRRGATTHYFYQTLASMEQKLSVSVAESKRIKSEPKIETEITGDKVTTVVKSPV